MDIIYKFLKAVGARLGGGLKSSPEDNGCLLADLENLGFFKYTRPEDLGQERTAILQHGWSGIFGGASRMFPADSEELAEGGVPELFIALTPFLRALRVIIPSLESDFGEDYTLIAGGQRFPIWTQAELEEDLAKPGLLWGVSQTRTLEILNGWLKKAGSSERAYGVNAGNDFEVFFLTPELFERICQDPAAEPHYGPYIPNFDYPGFGLPRP